MRWSYPSWPGMPLGVPFSEVPMETQNQRRRYELVLTTLSPALCCLRDSAALDNLALLPQVARGRR